MIRDALGDGPRFGVRIALQRRRRCRARDRRRHIPRVALARRRSVSGRQRRYLDATIRSRDALSLPLPADVAHFVLVPNPDFIARGDFGLDGSRVTDADGRALHVREHRRVSAGVLRRLQRWALSARAADVRVDTRRPRQRRAVTRGAGATSARRRNSRNSIRNSTAADVDRRASHVGPAPQQVVIDAGELNDGRVTRARRGRAAGSRDPDRTTACAAPSSRTML